MQGGCGLAGRILGANVALDLYWSLTYACGAHLWADLDPRAD